MVTIKISRKKQRVLCCEIRDCLAIYGNRAELQASMQEKMLLLINSDEFNRLALPERQNIITEYLAVVQFCAGTFSLMKRVL